MKYLILLSLITYTYACPAKLADEWKALGCVVENAAGTDASGLGIVEGYTQQGYGSCSISCTAGVWVITQTCATGFEESNCEICPVCVASSTNPPVCDANFYGGDITSCQPCPEGNKSPVGSISVEDCTAFDDENTRDDNIKSMFQLSKTADAGESPLAKRANYKALVKNLKTLIKANNNRMAIPKEDVVVNTNFRAKLEQRNIANVEVVIPKAKNTYDCGAEKDVDLGADEIAFSVELEDGEEALICSGDTHVTRLKRDGDDYLSYCYDSNAQTWGNPFPRSSGHDYECNGNTYYVGSLEGDNTGLSCAEYKEQWLQNKCCSAHNPATCDPISQGYEAEGCGTCS